MDSASDRDGSSFRSDQGGEAEWSLGRRLRLIGKLGTRKADLFAKLGLERVVDVLFYFPRSYQQLAPVRRVVEFEANLPCSVVGTIESVELRGSQDGGCVFGVLLQVEGGGYIRLTWFNQPYRRQVMARGQRWLATGLLKSTGISWEMRHPEVQLLAPDEEPPAAKPQPIYPSTEGLSQRQLRDLVAMVLEHSAALVPESLPEAFRQQHTLPSIGEALRAIHQPETIEEAERARHRFIFQELLTYQLAIAWRRHQWKHGAAAIAMPASGAIHARILQRLKLHLTADQEQAIREVADDMASTEPMNRLLQGDVGSGKTLVAQYAMLLAAAHRCQSALMVPTEILARQHAERLSRSLANSQCHVELLTGAVQGRERRELLDRIALGTVDLVVGTHALLSDKVTFARLGLVVIDEQHKFGVAQRAALRDDQQQPHYLLLSATPIPRTMTMTAMGEMDVSRLRQKPPGRAPVHTYLGKPEQMASWWGFVAKQVSAGRQAYVIVPRVAADAEEESRGVEQVFLELQQGPLAGLRLGRLHGRMESEEKSEALRAFEQGRSQVLVATTVVEVGIDVANATVMTILDADRLGLAQLHQLRGRVARGTMPGYVCLFARAGVSSEENLRLSALVETEDGFRLAEMDWVVRGPGNLLGTRQSGLPPFKIADLVRDADLAERTHLIARQLIESDPDLSASAWARLRQQVLSKHGNMFEYGAVG
jgi:ATP-dependent DNA helicase RecG